MDKQSFLLKLRAECHTVRRLAPVRLIQFYAMPALVCLANQFVKTHSPALVLGAPHEPPRDEELYETVNTGMFRHQSPVEPADFIVLAVSVVIALLRVPHFITHQNHGDTQGDQGGGHEIFYLPASQLLHLKIIGRALDSAVPASVIVSAVAVVLAVCIVVLPVVGNQVVECKPVETRYEVCALFGFHSTLSSYPR
jgi:hypothetical protein